MSKALFIAPTAKNSGLTSVCLGLVRALDNIGIRVSFFKPVTQNAGDKPYIDRSVHFIKSKSLLSPPQPILLKEAQRLISKKKHSDLMERVIELYSACAENADVVVVEGLAPDHNQPYIDTINFEVVRNLDADVILVATPQNRTPEELDEHIDMAARQFASPTDSELIGCILNKVNAPEKAAISLYESETKNYLPEKQYDYARQCKVFDEQKFRLLGSIPWRHDLVAPRTADITNELDPILINKGQIDTRRVTRITICARTVPNMVEQLKPGTLIVTPGDREDIILATCMAALSGVPLAGLVLTGNLHPDSRTLKLCQTAFSTGLPVVSTIADTFLTSMKLMELDIEVPINDLERIETVMSLVSSRIDAEWLKQHFSISKEPRLSPSAFRYQLTQRAIQAAKTIVLPEGNEPRTIEAAVFCQQKRIANCVLIGDAEEIKQIAESIGVTIPDTLTIINPDKARARYIQPMVELRKHKGLTSQMAEAQLEDNVVLATMMVALNEVDGLVSGAVHTTANTIRPALQLIKTRPGAKVVSSVFFMLLPEQVLVYGDCAVNPDPTAEELADIAIQSAESAEIFGVKPKVAMISYSTGSSGSGSDVEKVRKATEIAKAKKPDLLIDGPLQYDAAANEEVARTKAPNSPVAGKTTVFVFPDLNTGNTTYKAVQRSANVVSIGPMLQGLRKPVNDLSRGALVEDIIYTIALTAVQSLQDE